MILQGELNTLNFLKIGRERVTNVTAPHLDKNSHVIIGCFVFVFVCLFVGVGVWGVCVCVYFYVYQHNISSQIINPRLPEPFL